MQKQYVNNWKYIHHYAEKFFCFYKKEIFLLHICKKYFHYFSGTFLSPHNFFHHLTRAHFQRIT